MQSAVARLLTRHARGFTLIELSIVLTIIGLMSVFGLRMLSQHILAEKLSDGRRTVRVASDEIRGFILLKKKVPKTLDELSHTTDPWQKPLYLISSGMTCADLLVDRKQPQLSIHVGNRQIQTIVAAIGSGGMNLQREIEPGAVLQQAETADDLLEFVDASEMALLCKQ